MGGGGGGFEVVRPFWSLVSTLFWKIYVKADLHDATLTHATSLPRAYNMTWDHLHAHDFFQLQN